MYQSGSAALSGHRYRRQFLELPTAFGLAGGRLEECWDILAAILRLCCNVVFSCSHGSQIYRVCGFGAGFYPPAVRNPLL